MDLEYYVGKQVHINLSTPMGLAHYANDRMELIAMKGPEGEPIPLTASFVRGEVKKSGNNYFIHMELGVPPVGQIVAVELNPQFIVSIFSRGPEPSRIAMPKA